MASRRHFLIGLLALAPLFWSLGAQAAQDEATALVKRTAERMLSTLEARRAEVDRNPSLIYGMVESIVAPHFDFQRITQGALGQYWRQATPAQQQRLVDGFKQVLIRTYARSLLSYSGEEIRYLPVKPGSRPSTVTVSTEVREPGAAPIPVDYRMYNNGNGWKVYDVVINNASLVGNYRSSFANEIRQSGVDGLIAKLVDMNQKGQG
ncbi:MlaC/ttg2D family ABC transporter substrate-binding protein [Thiorhodococcus minor]|uniref:ABC transporter substrate-binding protein n=1 Tax=Thiorhodococcus minor TaxID=57489 RepID=A0A6M0JZY6_9GAMM|nr:ABC transporter substrate-binding protein [Thiorhodococcus minor]NEV63076.1 ABC transporter substrate-binding protein [Thiorhodococcus minor]